MSWHARLQIDYKLHQGQHIGAVAHGDGLLASCDAQLQHGLGFISRQVWIGKLAIHSKNPRYSCFDLA